MEIDQIKILQVNEPTKHGMSIKTKRDCEFQAMLAYDFWFAIDMRSKKWPGKEGCEQWRQLQYKSELENQACQRKGPSLTGGRRN